jgi:DNA-binding NarL/FixJ family response regulator
MTGRLRVLVADDHPLFLDGLVALLSTEPDVDVVASATTGEEAVARAAELRPEIVILDLQLPGIDGVETARRILRAAPATAVLMLTMFDDDASVLDALLAGARGYILKEAAHDEVLLAVRAVGRGEAIFGPEVAGRLARFVASSRREPDHPFPHLTQREREVLELVARGIGNQAIAERLGISEKTVRNQVSTVISKLQAADRAEAIAMARDAGIGRPRFQPPGGRGASTS